MTLIAPTDVVYLLAAPTAVAGFSVQGVPGNSWGNYCSTTPWSTTPLDNLFGDITGPENAASQVDYACVFIWNNTLTGNSMLNAIAWLPTGSLTAGGATVAIAADTTVSKALSSTSAQALGISGPTLSPSGLSVWAAPSSSNAGGVALGNIAPGFVKAVWIQRTALNNTPVNNQTIGLQVDFSSNG